MTTATVLVIAVVVVAAAILAWYFLRQQRSKKLKSQFGPEYTHAIDQYGNQAKAEDALIARQKRHEKLKLRSLSIQNKRILRPSGTRPSRCLWMIPPGRFRTPTAWCAKS